MLNNITKTVGEVVVGAFVGALAADGAKAVVKKVKDIRSDKDHKPIKVKAKIVKVEDETEEK